MRQIKFRAWDFEAKKMFIPATIPNYIPEDGSHYDYMQYTGLTDKNGKEIFEGDIIKENALDENMKNLISHVVYDHGGFETDDGEYLWDAITSLDGKTCTVEVIGNIYENPELLK